MIVRQPKSASGFQTILDREGWKDALSPYAVLLGHLAARLDGDDDAAKRFLTDSAGKLAQDWPYPVVQFLRGELDESAVLDQATDNEKRTEAYCFLGLDHELKKNVDKARADFRWVKESGSRESVEYGIAVAELERMEGGKK
jgi:lipoprotein NlpI